MQRLTGGFFRGLWAFRELVSQGLASEDAAVVLLCLVLSLQAATLNPRP